MFSIRTRLSAIAIDGDSLLQLGADLGHNLSDSLLLDCGGLLVHADPLAVLGVGLDEGGLGLDNLADGLRSGLSGASRVSSDGSVGLGVELLDVLGFGGGQALFPLGELSLEGVGILLLEQVVVGLDVSAQDVVLVLLGLELGFLLAGGLLDLLATLVGDDLGFDDLEAGESLLVVGNVETTVSGTLHSTEDTVTSGGAHETDIEVSLEGASVLLDVVPDGEQLAVDLGLAFVEGSHVLESEEATSEQETSCVGGGVVGETSSDAESSELLRISAAHGEIALDGGVDNGGDDSAVGASDTESVLLLVVLVLVLEDEAATCLVVGLTLATTEELGLVTGAVGAALEDFDECHLLKLLIINTAIKLLVLECQLSTQRWGHHHLTFY